MTFSSFNLHARVVSGIPQSFITPTPIQSEAIPKVMAGRDLLGLAQTGTGKTAAFVLPILHRLMEGPRGRVRALVIAPTRELAEQICECVQELGGKTGLKATTVYGGASFGGQAHRLRRGAEIVVACPGRLLDHIGRRTVDLRQVEVLVLDEADHMFDMGFLPNVRQILKALPKSRQTLLFSATMPDELRGLATDVLTNPETVQIGRRAPTETVAHFIYPVEQNRKNELLLKLLKEDGTGSVLVFGRTKQRVKRLATALEQTGLSVASLQGNLSQSRRQSALNGFKSGRFQILVATDIAARGIDVESVTHVINYDIPDTVEAYTHRIGRTGRAQRTGDAFTFVTAEDESMVRSIERALGSKIERRAVDGFTRIAAEPMPENNSSRSRFYGPRSRTGGRPQRSNRNQAFRKQSYSNDREAFTP